MAAEIKLGWNNSNLQAGAAGAAAIVNKASGQMKVALSGIGQGIGINPMLGVAAASAGAVLAIKNLANEYDHIWDVSQRLNESPESIQRIGLMAKLAGTDLDATAKALQKMNLELRKGEDSEGVKALKIMGVDAAEFIKLSPEKQISALAAAFQKAQESGVGFVEVQTLLGKKFSDLLPLLRSSAAELKKMSEAQTVSDEDVEAIAKANDEWDKLKHTVGTGVTTALVGAYNYLAKINGAFEETDRSIGNSLGFWRDFTDNLKISTELQEKDARASAMLSEKKREQQRTLDAITAAQSAAISKADEIIKKAKEEATARDKTAKATAKQVEEIEKLKDALDDANEKTSMQDASPKVQQQNEIKKLDSLDKGIEDAGLMGDEKAVLRLKTERAEVLSRIGSLEKEIKAETQRTVDEEEKLAEATAKRARSNQQGLDILLKELDIIEATASGHDKKAEKLQRELDIQEKALQIVERTGLAYAEAGAIATRMVDAKEKADDRGGDKVNGRSKIHGYSKDQGGEGDARERASKRVNDARENAQKARDSKSGYGGMSESRLTPRGGDIGAKTPATDPEKGGDPATQAGAIVTQILPQILSILSGQ